MLIFVHQDLCSSQPVTCSKFSSSVCVFVCLCVCAAVRPRSNKEQESTRPQAPGVAGLGLSRPSSVGALRPQHHLLHLPVQSLRWGSPSSITQAKAVKQVRGEFFTGLLKIEASLEPFFQK